MLDILKAKKVCFVAFGLIHNGILTITIPELIESEKSGLLVPEKNPEQLAQAIQRLIDDPALRNNLAAEGFRRVQQHFNAVETNAQLMSLFLESISIETDGS